MYRNKTKTAQKGGFYLRKACSFNARYVLGKGRGIRSCLLQSNLGQQFLCFAKAFGQPLKTTHRVVFLKLSFEALLLSTEKQNGQAKNACPFCWRRKRDSNPRGLSPKRFSRPPRYDRFDIPPLGITVESIAIIAYFVNRISKIVALKSVVVFGDVARDVFDHFAGDNKSRDRRNERKRARRRAAARIHVVRVRRGFLFHRFFG